MANWMFDRSGRPTLFLDGDCICDRRGHVAAWINGSNVHSRRGAHVGWFGGGVVYDSTNGALPFTGDRTGSTPSQPGRPGHYGWAKADASTYINTASEKIGRSGRARAVSTQHTRKPAHVSG